MDKYLVHVQAAARSRGKRFFLDSGEGNDLGHPDDEWYAEELSGWLIDESRASLFETLWANKMDPSLKSALHGDPWGNDYCFVEWRRLQTPSADGCPVSVRFVLYPDFEKM